MSFKDNLIKRKNGSYSLKSKSKKVQKKGTCIECGQNGSTRDLMYEYDSEDVINVREYMEDHLVTYSNHQTMTPVWCPECKALTEYRVSLNERN